MSSGVDGISLCFIAGGCTGIAGCLDLLQRSYDNDIIAYACANVICVVKAPSWNSPCQLLSTAANHSSAITCVRWLEQFDVKASENVNENFSFLLSGSSGNDTFVLWKFEEVGFTLQMQRVLTNNSVCVQSVAGCFLKNLQSVYCVCCAADTTMQVWSLDAAVSIGDDCGERACITVRDRDMQRLDLGRSLPLCVEMSHLPDCNCLIVAVGLESGSILLFTQDSCRLALAFCQVQHLRGHDDWIRGLSFISGIDGTLWLASCAQDCLVKVWKMVLQHSDSDLNGVEEEVIKLSSRSFAVSDGRLCDVSLETVLCGHDDWVYSARWHPVGPDGQLILMSASMDKSIIEWSYQADSGMWSEKTRLGETGGQNVGFFGAVYNSDGSWICAHGYNGGIYLWNYDKQNSLWKPEAALSGHFDSVESLSWSPSGNYILTTSLDQSTRLFSSWKRDDKSLVTYHELARPQIHGHNLFCLASVSDLCFLSGAEEKMLRVFTASTSFLHSFSNITKLQIQPFDADNLLPLGAALPALGLSNLPIFKETSDVSSNIDNDAFTKENKISNSLLLLQLQSPPTESQLLQGTLWPEIRKLYGHGYELHCVAVNHDGSLAASSCRANNKESAAIIVWTVTDWKLCTRLEAHSLTVTQLSFSNSDLYLLSVSRDRTWTLFLTKTWQKVAQSDKRNGIHSRIIWSCSWSFDSKYFLTCSRDKKICAWKLNEDEIACADCDGSFDASLVQHVCTCEMPASVTAVCCAPYNVWHDARYLCACGLEDGMIYLFSLSNISNQFIILTKLDQSIAHGDCIKMVQFRPVKGRMGYAYNSADDSGVVQLASCAADHIFKIFDIHTLML